MQRRVFYARLSGAGRGQTAVVCPWCQAPRHSPILPDHSPEHTPNPRPLRRCHHAQAAGRTFLALVYALPLARSSNSN